MRANLYVVTGNVLTLVDGNLTNYNNIYSNNVDMNDGWKMPNPGINFGIYRSTITLAVERRSIYVTSDTTFFRMWNMLQNTYSLKLMLKNLNHQGMQGFIKDNYLNTETAIGLNDTTFYNFTVDANPASADEMRLQLVYAPAIVGVLDVNITGISAQRKGSDILLNWSVAGETSMASYIVEHSTDGRDFSAIQQVSALNTATAKKYDYTDIKPSAAVNFYRIKAVSLSGKIQYSPVARVNAIDKESAISIYPNPVVNKTVQLQFSNQPAGRYNSILIYDNGVQEQLQSFQVNEGQASLSLSLPKNLQPGVYRLQFSGPDNSRIVKTIIVL